MSKNETFGFKVKRATRYDYDRREDVEGYWRVHLPHQCDRWDIAGEKYGDGAELANAVDALSRFIAEAQLALDALKAEREFPAVPAEVTE